MSRYCVAAFRFLGALRGESSVGRHGGRIESVASLSRPRLSRLSLSFRLLYLCGKLHMGNEKKT